MIPKREADKGKAQLKRFLQEMGAKISNENEKDDVWAINAQLGNFTVVFNYKFGMSSAIAIFPVNIPDSALAILTPINDVLNDPKRKAEFLFGLHSVLTSPVTTYSLNILGGKFHGFNVMKSMFITHSSFSIKELDSVVNAIISIGNLGILYLQSKTGENGMMQQKISESTPPDSRMFG